MTFKPLPILTLFSVIGLAILITLGNWQYARYQEKLAAIGRPPEEIVVENATPIQGQAQLVYAVKEGIAGWRIFAPVRANGQTLFLDTAFRPGLAPPDWRELAPFAEGDIAFRGAKATPQKASWAAGKPDPAEHLWYAIDLPAMTKSAGQDAPAPYYLAMSYLGPDGRLAPNPFAHAADALPPERHLGYAWTWWGLAGALVAVYAAFHIRAGRLAFGRKA